MWMQGIEDSLSPEWLNAGCDQAENLAVTRLKRQNRAVCDPHENGCA